MKTRNYLILFALSLSVMLSDSLNAQWDEAGNNINSDAFYLGGSNLSSYPLRFKHFVNANYGRFEWWTNIGGSTLERMRLTNGGWLGLNTANPQMMLHVNNGGILSTGTTGNQPALNPGSRFIWVPGRRS